MLAGARYRYTKTLWITGLADRLPLYESVDEAIARRSGGWRHRGWQAEAAG